MEACVRCALDIAGDDARAAVGGGARKLRQGFFGIAGGLRIGDVAGDDLKLGLGGGKAGDRVVERDVEAHGVAP